MKIYSVYERKICELPVRETESMYIMIGEGHSGLAFGCKTRFRKKAKPALTKLDAINAKITENLKEQQDCIKKLTSLGMDLQAFVKLREETLLPF